jgi:hypothetical protein
LRNAATTAPTAPAFQARVLFTALLLLLVRVDTQPHAISNLHRFGTRVLALRRHHSLDGACVPSPNPFRYIDNSQILQPTARHDLHVVAL